MKLDFDLSSLVPNPSFWFASSGLDEASSMLDWMAVGHWWDLEPCRVAGSGSAPSVFPRAPQGWEVEPVEGSGPG